MKKTGMALKVLLPILVLGLAIGVMVLLIKGRPSPVQQSPAYRGVLVEILDVTRRDHPIRVVANGAVQARREAEIVPQVSGQVTEISPKLLAGGFFQGGELLFAIEAVDFELALQRAGANLSRAELDLETVRAQAEIARREWQRLHPGEEPNPLVVYQPQMKNAEAVLASAKAALRQAELDLQRTKMTAPFNCYIRSETVDFGQYLRSGTKVATVVGTNRVEIIVPLPLDDLDWLKLPGLDGKPGSTALVRLESEGQKREWTGVVDRFLGEVDARGRMARVAVTVNDPYALESANAGRPQLVVGSFVEVVLEGKTLNQVVELPRDALRDNDTVWIMDEEDRLRIQPAEVVRRERESVLISAGLKAGDRVVLTPISGAADGLLLRLAESAGATAEKGVTGDSGS